MTAKIYYAEIGEYMSRREKLDRLNELGDIDGVEWQEIIPNEHGDWIDQRGDEFSELKPIEEIFKATSNSDFIKISQIGKQLADLHLNYETQSPPDGIILRGIESGDFRVRKIKLDKKDPTRIRFNDSIWIENVPIEVNEYRVNGRSPVEWIIERYSDQS